MLWNSEKGLKAPWFARFLPYEGATGRRVRMELNILEIAKDALGEDWQWSKIKNIITGNPEPGWVAILWQPRGFGEGEEDGKVGRRWSWEGNLRGRRLIYTYGWSMLMYGWHHHDIVIILQVKIKFKKEHYFKVRCRRFSFTFYTQFTIYHFTIYNGQKGTTEGAGAVLSRLQCFSRRGKLLVT